jgi:hypothetical protein
MVEVILASALMVQFSTTEQAIGVGYLFSAAGRLCTTIWLPGHSQAVRILYFDQKSNYFRSYKQQKF